MSTEYYTEPGIPYEKFLETKSFEFSDRAEGPIYNVPHKLMRNDSGSLWVHKDNNGNARFERFGRQNHELLIIVAKEFNVTVFDEYGLRHPDESD